MYRPSIWEIKPTHSIIGIGKDHKVHDNLTFIVSTHPYFGYGTIVNPKAKFDDGQLHVTAYSGLGEMVKGYVNARFEIPGTTMAGKIAHIISKESQKVQLDGDLIGERTQSRFRILPKHVRLIY